jgi:2-keto-4-pentenoate hydratase/2-oxohepta-3-ene-1,7-dioic acid hydratase in catechol pathway
LSLGDIIATGACAGVGMELKPLVYLQNRDLVKIAIEDTDL